MQTSILSILLSPEAHQDTLLKILNESHILEGIATKDLEYVMGQIVETNKKALNEDEFNARRHGTCQIAPYCS